MTASGFVDLGYVSSGGIKRKPATHDIPAWGNKVVVLQDSYSVSLDVFFDFVHPDFWALVFGPQYAAAQMFSRIDPHWYLRGDDA